MWNGVVACHEKCEKLTSTSFAACVACRAEQFTCIDGTCVPGNSRCNDIPECPDGSDELACRKFDSLSKNNPVYYYLSQMRMSL